MNQRLYLDLKQRLDLTTFIHRTFKTVAPAQTYHGNWHIKAMAHYLGLCASGKIKRLLITLPPRHLKSICASVAFPAWVLGHDPSKRIICASYSADLASKHAHDCRIVMEANWYQRIFPYTRISKKNAEMDFRTTRHGYRYSTSIGGTLTGRGGNILIIDDPLKSERLRTWAALFVSTVVRSPAYTGTRIQSGLTAETSMTDAFAEITCEGDA